MARLSQREKYRKQAQAKELYIKNFDLAFISQTVGVKAETVRTWAKEGGWEDLRKAMNITPSQIQQMILACAHQIKEGQKPSVSPDQLAKLAAAYEKMSDKRKHLGYMIDAFTELRSFLLLKSGGQNTAALKTKYLTLAQELTPHTEELIQNKFKALQ